MTAASASCSRMETGRRSTASTQMEVYPLVPPPTPMPARLITKTAQLLSQQTTSATTSHGTPKTIRQVKSASSTSRFAQMAALMSRTQTAGSTAIARPRKATLTTRIQLNASRSTPPRPTHTASGTPLMSALMAVPSSSIARLSTTHSTAT